MHDISTAGPLTRDSILLCTCRLWSLWDMLRFNASSFYFAVTALNMGRTLISERKDRGDQQPSPNDHKRLKAHLGNLDKSLRVLGARVTQIGVDTLQFQLQKRKSRPTYKEIGERLSELGRGLINAQP